MYTKVKLPAEFADRFNNLMSARIYTLIEDPPLFQDRFNELYRCAKKRKILDSPWPVLSDAYNVFYKAVMNFGRR
ncbi:hypothetical protein MRX96_008403 [Rhipicephalus microplus]